MLGVSASYTKHVKNHNGSKGLFVSVFHGHMIWVKGLKAHVLGVRDMFIRSFAPHAGLIRSVSITEYIYIYFRKMVVIYFSCFIKFIVPTFNYITVFPEIPKFSTDDIIICWNYNFNTKNI